MSEARAPRQAFIVSHTHWDREWYLTFHEFRVNLVQVVRKVLEALEEDPSFRHFVLDGQAIILEDYLEVHPEDRGRIERLVRDGALSIGPWYILPDEFLVSAESTVRNLILGHQVAGDFGSVQKVGYMPDSFGHIAQIPQILRLAGLDTFIYTRGHGDEIDDLGLEYMWQAPDGSEVLAINQLGGYCNAAGLGFEELWHAHTRRKVDPKRAIRQTRDLFAKMNDSSNGDVYLLNNGCDHFPPQQEFQLIFKTLQRAFPGTEFRHTSFEEYARAVRVTGIAKKPFQGELIRGKAHHILSGVWSARMYLKQQNDEAQILLSSYLEPFSAYMHFALGIPYPESLLQSSWKLLLQNHPHDSICGCSTDEVHRAMVPRFDGVIQTAQQLLRQELRHLAPAFGPIPDDDRHTTICVANPLPVIRSEVVERLIVLAPPEVKPDRLQLFDSSGRAVPFLVVKRERVRRFWGIDYRSELFAQRQRLLYRTHLEEDRTATSSVDQEESDWYLTIRFFAESLPALGHATYYLRETRSTVVSVANPVTVSADTLENEFYRVRVHPNGTFDLLDKETGRHFSGLNLLEDTEDVGDEYDYSPCVSTETVTAGTCVGRIRFVEACDLSAALQVDYNLLLPQSIHRDRRERSRRRVKCRVSATISLRKRCRLVEIDLEFHNRAKDHRLRVRFPTGIESQTLVSDGHFHINHRPIEQPKGDDWAQPPSGTYPQQDFSLVQDGQIGLAIFNKGLPEIEATRDRQDRVTLHLTLLRSVGWLSRGDFMTRKHSNAGPTIRTPDAQCQGQHRFHYAVVAFSGDDLQADIKGLSLRYKTPVLAVQGVENGHVAGGESFLRKKTHRTAISAIKKHGSRDTLVLRIYNLTHETVEEGLFLGKKIRGCWRINLLEERLGDLGTCQGSLLTFRLRPHEILSLEIDLEPGQ